MGLLNMSDESGVIYSEVVALPKKVAVVYSDVKREYFVNEEDYLTEEDADKYAESVAKYIAKMGIEVEAFACDDAITQRLKSYAPDMALNLVDSIRGDTSLGSSVPGLFEVLHIPYTGAGVLGWSLNTNKFLTYQLLRSQGIPVPNHQLVSSASDMLDPGLRYPLFPKLNIEHSSIGVGEDSVCENERELRAKLRDLISQHKQAVLIDEFIAGIEVTSAVLDGLNTKVYTVQRDTGGETKSDIMTFEKKWVHWQNIGYTKYDAPGLREYVKKAFDILKMSDYARIDIRIDHAGRFYFIDPNTNPFFGPVQETHSTYSIILEMYGISFEETLKRIFLNTARDAQLSSKA